MKSSMGDKERLPHILDACEKILLATREYDEERFINDFIITAAVCNFIMVIGEAASIVTDSFKKENPHFDWRLMKGMRNIIVHEYLGVDKYKVFETVINDIPKLKNDCLVALRQM